MKIALVRVPNKTYEITVPLGLGYLASKVRNIADVKIIDAVKEKLTISEVVRKLADFDVIGFQCLSTDFSVVKNLIKLSKEAYPDKILIVGGAHPSLDPINTFNKVGADYVFLGEAEESLYMFMDYLRISNLKKNLNKIPGIVYKNKTEIKINPPKLLENLDDYNPSWDLLNLKSYPFSPHGFFFKQKPIAPILTSRGCPFTCTYCGGPKIFGHKIRRHSIDFVMKQIDILVKEYGIKEIDIEDDNFTFDREYVLEFCRKVIERNYGINFTCPNGVRLDTFDDEVLSLMKKAGFYTLDVGIESGSDNVRKHMRKNLSVETIKNKIKLIRKHGFNVVAFFIIGYPTETLEDIKKTIKLACELDLHRAKFSFFKPLPGTECYFSLIKEGKIKDLDFDKFYFEDPTIVSDITEKELLDIKKRAFIKFYLRPKQMYRMIVGIRSFEHFKIVSTRIYNMLKSFYSVKKE